MKNMHIVFLGIILLFLAVPFATAAENNVSKLIVQGEAKASAAPDKATVVLGVQTRDASAANAVAENARLMNETIAALLAAGIAGNEIQTSSYSLGTASQDEPVMSQEKQKVPEFLASNIVTVDLNNTTDVGKVLDAAVSAGSNSIQEVSFDLSDPQPQKDQALTLAIEDARRKAEIAAKAAGVNLGRVLEISEGYGYVAAASRNVAFDIGTPIQPGKMEITASVTMTYEIS
ncbi:MAG TPA: SIMPL domain-containing protein [Methanothrix sp.]|nr:SIMPL domain-containing protein [Methanothrix sp.]